MKWVTIGILLYLTRNSDAGALKCRPESQEPRCLENRDISLSSLAQVKETASDDPECLAGSEWDSNCHYCRCSDTGVAECLKAESCDFGVIAEPIKCKPNTTFERDCNVCICLENGLGLCTLRACLPAQRRKLSQCEPGSSWKADCNTCTCSENGFKVCTKRACIHSDTRSRLQKRDLEQDTSKTLKTYKHTISKRSTCKANQEFQIDCNMCQCSANGQTYTCTQNECLEGDNIMNKEVEVFMETEGTDHIERHSVCKPSDTFYIACNTCHCNTLGTDYSCTNKPCPLPKDVELFHELIETSPPSSTAPLTAEPFTAEPLTATPLSASNSTKAIVCVANRMFIRDCNTCWCNEDGTSYFCTRRVCLPEATEETTEDPVDEVKLKVVKQSCRPNEVFELDCNMCRCNPDGKSYSCTRRACVEGDDKNSTLSRKTRAAQETKACVAGQEFRLDCNKCLCNDDGQDFSCTRMDCAAQNNNGGDTFSGARTKRELTEQVTTECAPGSVFDRNCDVCRCTEDGHHAVCALKPCTQKIDETTTTESAISFRCTPGDQFKRECNDCTCSADGKSVFCTLLVCEN